LPSWRSGLAPSSSRNPNETDHALDGTAETLYEAVVSPPTIKVRHPEVTHVVKIQDFENWLERGATCGDTTAPGIWC
jgi:hypothetical protein